MAISSKKVSFEPLFTEYSRSVYYFFLRRGFSHEESQELAQETFYRAFRSLENTEPGSNLKNWLFTIAANLYRNEIRCRTADKRKHLETPIDSLKGSELSVRDSDTVDPLQATLENERSQWLYSEVTKLPDQMRRCLVLRIVHDLKYDQIASVMQVSVNTVKSQLYQAKRKLEMQLS